VGQPSARSAVRSERTSSSALSSRRRLGRRDRALLLLAIHTGLRVSELVGLRRHDVTLEPAAYLSCLGKGRKQRSTPLKSETVAVLRAWLDESDGAPDDPLFPGPSGQLLTRDAIRRLVDRHTTAAATACPTLATNRVTPHTLRHTCAMQMLDSGVISTP
jgi:integrase